MTISARQLNRATLGRQLLLRREKLDIEDAVSRVMALQAQEPASPYLALWNRLAHFNPADLDSAFAEQTVVKATLMRLTLHAVHVKDYPHLYRAMLPSLRASCLNDARFTESGLSVADADALVPHVAAFTAQPRYKTEIEGMIETRLGFHHQGVWWALRRFAPLWQAPTGGPWSFGARPSFVVARAPSYSGTQNSAVQHLVQRYLEAFGPASVQDIAQFAMIARSVVKDALNALEGKVRQMKAADGTELFDVPGAWLPDEDTPAPPRLLPMWDSTLLAYWDRSRVIPPDYRQRVIRRNGDVLPTLLVDGYVAGVWRPVAGGVEATAFHPLSDEAWAGLATEAEALLVFLSTRAPNVYSRYSHWWDKLSDGETQILSG
jgi:hypothetical protein